MGLFLSQRFLRLPGELGVARVQRPEKRVAHFFVARRNLDRGVGEAGLHVRNLRGVILGLEAGEFSARGP